MASRTLYISIITVYTLILMVMFGYYIPDKIYQSELDKIEEKYNSIISTLLDTELIPDSTSVNFINMSRNDPQLAFMMIKTDSGEQVLKAEIPIESEKIQDYPVKKIITINDNKCLFLHYKQKKDHVSGIESIIMGIHAQKIINEYGKTSDIFLFALFLIFALSGVAIFLFEKFLRYPLNHITGYMKNYRDKNLQSTESLVASGLLELQYLVLELNALLNRIESGDKENVEITTRTELERNKHIDPISSLAQMPLELKHETSKDLLLEKANELITERYNFHISMIYIKEGPVYRFHNSHMKEMKILNDRLAEAIKDELLNEEFELLKKLNPFRPYVTSAPHFDKMLQSLNLRGHFIYQLIAADGILITGYLDEQVQVSESDLKRTTAMANYILLSLIDHESINRLRKQIKIKTNELEAANELLASSIKNKDMMLKLISHDLNAPLRNVYGLIDSIQRKYAGQLNEDINARLERIRNNINKEITMINDILENFKAVEKSDTLIAIDIAETIKTIENDLQYELDKKNVKIERLESYPVIYSDPYVIEHIFLNLIDNACKHFETNGNHNLIKIMFTENHQDFAFDIIDNGSGIPDDKLRQIDAYFKGEQEEIPKNTSGVGLGLALTKNLVDRINGKISVKNQQGSGCVFTVFFNKINIDSIQSITQEG